MSYNTTHGQELLYFPQYDDASTGFGLSRGADGEHATSLFGSVGRGRFTLQGAFDSRRKYVPTGAWRRCWATLPPTPPTREPGSTRR
jgi:hypothetical protein